MKRWIFWSFVSLPTFLLGTLLVFLYLYITTPLQTTLRVVHPTIQEEPSASEIIPPSDDFVPEFRDLPNFDEIEYPEWDDNRLIDIFQFGAVYRQGEVIAKSGESWLTLFEQNGKYSLKYAKAKVTQLSTTSYAGDELDVRLTFDKPGIPIFSLRKFKTLHPGKITTLYHRPSFDEIERRNLPIEPMEVGDRREFNLNETWYTLRASRGVAKDGTQLGLLVLETEKERQKESQIIYSAENEIIVGDLVWVGDLDKDGKLDVYFAPFGEKGGSTYYLYLSTEAALGDMVKLVAIFSAGGC